VVAGLRHIVESHILVVEDIQWVVVGTRKVVRVEPIQSVVDTAVAGNVEGTVEVNMVLALQWHQHMD